MKIVAWFFWNPSRDVFTIPLIHHPLKWYGLLFVTGFVVGYWIFLSMLVTYLKLEQSLKIRDISSWPKFLATLRTIKEAKEHPLYKLVATLPQKFLEQPTDENKKTLLVTLNSGSKALRMDRAGFSLFFPECVYSLRAVALGLADKLIWYVIAGTIIGARLGHVFLYEWPRYRDHLSDIVKIWEGGLASHGGAIGILLALIFYRKSIKKNFPELTYIRILDLIAIPTAFTACCIRIGNFVNQELIGKETTVPWAVIFGDPADGSRIAPRHAVQLYEALAYFIAFVLLGIYWQRFKTKVRPGSIIGLFFILVFGARFIIEFWKLPTSLMIDESFLQTSQLLSIPCILGGIALLIWGPCACGHKSIEKS